jgi:hypothetical protein
LVVDLSSAAGIRVIFNGSIVDIPSEKLKALAELSAKRQ